MRIHYTLYIVLVSNYSLIRLSRVDESYVESALRYIAMTTSTAMATIEEYYDNGNTDNDVQKIEFSMISGSGRIAGDKICLSTFTCATMNAAQAKTDEIQCETQPIFSSLDFTIKFEMNSVVDGIVFI